LRKRKNRIRLAEMIRSRDSRLRQQIGVPKGKRVVTLPIRV